VLTPACDLRCPLAPHPGPPPWRAPRLHMGQHRTGTIGGPRLITGAPTRHGTCMQVEDSPPGGRHNPHNKNFTALYPVGPRPAHRRAKLRARATARVCSCLRLASRPTRHGHARRVLLVPTLEQGDVQLAGVLRQLLHRPSAERVAGRDAHLSVSPHTHRGQDAGKGEEDGGGGSIRKHCRHIKNTSGPGLPRHGSVAAPSTCARPHTHREAVGLH
jgi:hypothetical protein